MTDTNPPEPIRKGLLPATPPPEWEFHTWFPLPDGGGDLMPGQRDRGAHVRRLVSYGDWEPVRPDRWAEEPPSDVAAVSVPASAPTDRCPHGCDVSTCPCLACEADETALRDRIAEALDNARHSHPCPVTGDEYWTGCYHPDGTSSSCHTHRRTAAVLAVLPAPADRAAILREAADHLETLDPTEAALAGQHAWADAARELRRVAGEAQQPETQLPFTYVDDDGDRLDIGADTAGTLDGNAPIVYVVAEGHGADQATVYVRPERVDEVIAALRAARRAAEALPAVVSQPDREARTVCVCGHTRGEHLRVSGRLLCDACDPDSTDNRTCDGFDEL